MEQRNLGNTGFRVPALSLGTGTFGGGNEFFAAWGSTDDDGARHLVDICLEAGLNMFDTADIYSQGLAETILGKAIAGRRDKVIISTKGSGRFGDGPNDVGTSRHHLKAAVDGSLRRLGTDYIDLYQIHSFDPQTSIEETMYALDELVKAGKIRYLGVSNFSGWHLAQSLATAEKHHLQRYVAHQAYYSLIGRDYEWELMPLGAKEGVSAVVWSPLGWGRLTGKIRRGSGLPKESRLHVTGEAAPPVAEEVLFKVVDALVAVGEEVGKSVPQVALNWLLRRPTVANVIVGARDEKQLRENLGAVGWALTAEQVRRLDEASAVTPAYPYWHQRGHFPERQLPLV